MQVKMIEFYSELIRQRDNPTDDAFKVTLKGLTALEVQKVADFVKEDLMKNSWIVLDKKLTRVAYHLTLTHG